MQKFDVFKIGADFYAVVQAEHLLELNTVVLVPILPSGALPALSKLTVDIQIEDEPYRVRSHMPLTVEAQRMRHMKPVCRLSPAEGQKVMDGLNAVLWGL
ncbi:CcdB family protein [Limimaricola cinnabarinus]|uniref:CcdB family protein n=1 Tax=Limimaricola cinnabarinus TaxID=1125964 RepID=UPI002FE3DBCA